MAIEGPGAEHNGWMTAVARPGQGGLQLNRALDALDPTELSRMLNLLHTGDGRLVSRPGLQQLATASTGDVHTIGRLNDPQNSTRTHVWGLGTQVYRGEPGSPITQVSGGYSGDPITLVPHRPTLSSAPWMIAADRNKMALVPMTGAVLPLGVPAPSVAAVAAVQPIVKKTVCSFSASDSTQASKWNPIGGQDRSTPPVLIAAPPDQLATDSTGSTGAAAVTFASGPGAAVAGYSNFWVCTLPAALDLSTITGGVAASDDDIVHIWMRLSKPASIEEVRIYLIAGPYGVKALPGQAQDQNTDSYVKAFAPSDIQPFIDQRIGGTTAAQTVATNDATRTYLDQSGDPTAPNEISPIPAAPGNTWTEFGVIGLPVRRGDFTRIGNSSSNGWNNISAIAVFIQTTNTDSVTVDLSDMYLTGGYGPDTSDPTTALLDYRYTYYDPRTGDESNGSPIQTTTLNALRQKVNLTPVAHPDAAMRERWYRRGGTLPTDWFFLNTSTSHGQEFEDTYTDAATTTAGVIPKNHDQPVTTVNSAGATVSAQPLPAVWGPTDGGYLFGCGDPYRPGFLYWPIPGQPGHWPAANTVEVCSPSEQLMNGCVWGGQAYVFSRERLYVIYPDFDGSGAVRVNSTACTHGLVSRWGFCPTPEGLGFVTRDAVRLTAGSGSSILSEQLTPLFHGQSVNGFSPIDLTAVTDIRLAYHDRELWFLYRDTGGTMRCLVYHMQYKYWRQHQYAAAISSVYSDTSTDRPQLWMGGKTNGTAYQQGGFTDDGTAIAWALRTGAWDAGAARPEKSWGDVILDADLQGASVTAQVYLNAETVANSSQSVAGVTGRVPYIFDEFGTIPQKARTVSIDLSGTVPITAGIALNYLGVSYLLQPEVTLKRATDWDDLESPNEKYLIGVTIEADTNGAAIPLIIEYDLNGVVLTASSITITTNGRHKQRFTWPAVKADLVRIRPTGACAPWQLYRADWLSQPEPPRVAGWDTNWETKGDTYYTGVDIECDTFGVAKTIQVYVDQTLVATKTVTANGRRLVHVTLTPARGHVYRFVATDTNPGLLYAWNWMLQAEPGEQTNWNQNYTIAHTLSDKYLKGVLLECDTFNALKTVTVEIDGTVQETLNVTQNGRGVQQFAFPQHLGRVFRLLPTDSNPGRLYSLQWIFDEEPLALSRWETQETDHQIHKDQSILWANVTLKSSAAVTLTVQVYTYNGTLITTLAPTALASTGGVKAKRYVTFVAHKGVLFKYLLTSSAPFTLYREETQVLVKAWGGNEPFLKRPFGNDDLDETRGMGRAELGAAHGGGQAT